MIVYKGINFDWENLNIHNVENDTVGFQFGKNSDHWELIWITPLPDFFWNQYQLPLSECPSSTNINMFSITSLIPTIQSTAEDPHITKSFEIDGKITFISNRDGNFEIYVVDDDGSNLKRLTYTGDIDEYSPRWSPDGEKIVYQASRDGYSDIYVMNPNGSNQTRLTFSGSSRDPAWSPDGKKIVYIDSWNIKIMDQLGSSQIFLTDTETNKYFPEWMPEENKIFYISVQDGWGLYTMNVDGSNNTYLIDFQWSKLSWSAITKLFTYSLSNEGNSDIYVMNSDGSNQTRLTETICFEGNPVWSPDGKKIAFDSDRSGNFDVFIMDSDGSNIITLAFSPAVDGAPDWKP